MWSRKNTKKRDIGVNLNILKSDGNDRGIGNVEQWKLIKGWRQGENIVCERKKGENRYKEL